jgi:selenocysteine lyase/cysteine desulfurase
MLDTAGMDAAALRAQFPVLERVAYLNAGTDGPLPAAAVAAARAELAAELEQGRTRAHFERRSALVAGLREGYAGVLGCAAADVALTTSTSEGLGKVLAGMDLGPGDEIVTSDSEHPGMLGPLRAARDRGVAVRPVPLHAVADAVGPSTTVVACSHVGWRTGELAPAALAETGVPVLLDGAQGAGAVPVDVGALGCAAYAGSGQKWLCGADGTGMLYVEAGFAERVRVTAPSYMSFEDASQGMDGPLRADARRFDAPALARETAALSLAALELLVAAGFDAVLDRARRLAAELVDRLAERGHAVAPRADTTLVSWADPDPTATHLRLAEAGVAVRYLPGTPYLRASVGAWNDEGDLERLLSSLAAAAG